MRIRRDILIVGGLFFALTIFLILIPNDTPTSEGGTTSHSQAPRGTLALYRWLEELDYQVERLEYRDFSLDADSSLLFILGTPEPYTPAEVNAVLRWVEAGGTLILANDRQGGGSADLMQALDVGMKTAPNSPLREASVTQPVTSVNRVTVETKVVFEHLPTDAAPLVGAENALVLVGIQQGKGYIYLSSTLHPFTNAGIRDAGSAPLILNLLRRVPAASQIIFDEYHHGFVREPSLGSLLTTSPWGWALIYAGLMGSAYIVLTGRRFGRPIPLREETARRSSAEYLESMAGLLRRGRKSGYLLAHYRGTLKRRLARPYGINPKLDDDAFVQALAAVRPLDTTALRNLLSRMNRSEVADTELLHIIAEADRF